MTSPRRRLWGSPTGIEFGAFESNIQGTWNLLEACRRSPRVRSVVVSSSDKAYGETHSCLLQLRHFGRHPYDVSKSCATCWLNVLFDLGLPVTSQPLR